MTEEGLLKTYELFFKRVEFIIDLHQKRLTFFWSIISAITGAVVVGLFNLKTNSQYFLLAIGPCLIFFIAYMAKVIIHRDKEDLLHNISTMIKLEDILGLTSKNTTPNSYWVNDSIISESHIKYRKKFKNSDDFVQSTLSSRGIHLTYMNLFTFLEIFSVLSVLSLVILGLI